MTAPDPRSQPAPRELARVLGPLEATTIVVGGIIGSGIFLAPSLVARQVGSPGASLLVWLLAGVFATFGALCYAELAGAIPETGSSYPYLRRAYRHPMVAFLYGWTFFFVDGAGSIAAVATACASYAGYFLEGRIPYGPTGVKVGAVAVVAALVVVNVVGVKFGGRVQNALTALKVGALLAIVALALLSGKGSADHFAAAGPPADGATLFGAIGRALIPTLFAYSGWTFSTYVSGEIRDPSRNVPRSIVLGMGIVMAIYLAVNAAYLYVLPFDRLQRSTLPASDAMVAAVGPWGGALVAVAVVVSTLGALNAAILSYPRLAFAMADDGLFFRATGRIHPRYGTPAVALVVLGAISALVAVSGSYERILGYFSFVDYVFFCAAIVGLFVLRRREPDLPRPYRVWGYPVTPLLFLAVSAAYLWSLLQNRLGESMVGIVLALVGVPFYFYFRNRPRGSSA